MKHMCYFLLRKKFVCLLIVCHTKSNDKIDNYCITMDLVFVCKNRKNNFELCRNKL